VTRSAARRRPRWAVPRPRLLGRAVHRELPGILAWSAMLIVLIAVYSACWPAIRGSATYQQVFGKLPDSYRRLFATSELAAATSYFNTELLTVTAPLVLLIAAITTGTRCVAGLEQTGELEMLLAHPVSRTRWVLEQATAVLLGLVAIAGITTMALLAADLLAHTGLGLWRVVAIGLHLAVLASWFGLLAVAVGAGTGRPVLTRLVCTAVALVAYLVNVLGALSERLATLRALSVFRWTLANDPLATGVHAPALAGVLSSAAVLLLAGTTVFRRRDLRR
jgi:ABC-2 type transport system permease protein